MVAVTSPLLLEECESVLSLSHVRALTNPPLDDDLIQRQMRYADRAWTPPAQGGDRRADDTEAEGGGG